MPDFLDMRQNARSHGFSRLAGRFAVHFFVPAIAAMTLILLGVPETFALPIGFGRNQADLEFDEAKNSEFVVYFDREVPEEGKFTLRALEAARPILEHWTGSVRDRRLPVILSSVTSGASFANFITDALEIQTMGLGSRSLVWHEYTHAMMYRPLSNIFGPAGAIIHLPWMPVWFIEGLAEATSVSSGSDFMAAVERYQAVSGKWPSYDRMHSLYASDFSLQGYAASGAFVSWLLRQSGPEKLPEILGTFRDRSMPWWWPWAAVPFNGFMPMDHSLGEPGRQLYRRYQEWAREHHSADAGGRPRLLTVEAESQGAVVLAPGQSVNGLTADFDPATGWLRSISVSAPVATDASEKPARSLDPYLRRSHVRRRGKVRFWMEHRKGRTAFCHTNDVPSTENKVGVVCPVGSTFPETTEFLGEDPADGSVYLARHLHFLLRDSYAILRWTPQDSTSIQKNVVNLGSTGDLHPVAIARDGTDLVLLSAGRKNRYLVWFDRTTGSCTGMHRMADFPVNIENVGSDILVSLWVPGGRVVKRIPTGKLKTEFPVTDCSPKSGPTSPLLEALRASKSIISRNKDSSKPIDLASAWKMTERDSASPRAPSETISATEEMATEAAAQSAVRTNKSAWRGRSVLAFPWIGADDALGPQIGFVSVPLMDHLQNETVRLTFLVGAASRYPNTDLRLMTTRWRPTLSAAVYRQQTYNGIAKTPDDELELSYLDESGLKLESDWAWRDGRTSYGVTAGVKRARLRPYLGPAGARSGFLTEWTGSFAAATMIFGGQGSVSESLAVRVAPETENSDFAYDSLAAQATIAWRPPVTKSILRGGLEASRTRGKRMRDLKEVYRPLKTFVPGSGGGLNQNSFGLAGEGWLFAGRYGDTQGRVKAEWTMPLIEDFEKLLWIFYVERLDFSAFLNYGGAWRGAEPQTDRLMAAHGYNLDLQFDNKGVRFNLGGGVGQVFEKPWEAYLTFGFDALF